MRELDRALADIGAIRQQIGRVEDFRGYGPATVGATGLLAAAVATAQSLRAGSEASSATFVAVWIATAAVAVCLVGAEAATRSRRLRSRLADAMILAAAMDFLPAGMAGTALCVLLMRYEPGATWMLPGLWQMLLSLGFFAASRSLPRTMAIVGGWYMAAGFATLAVASSTHALSPWAMGLPFTAGQILAAVLLRRDLEVAQ